MKKLIGTLSILMVIMATSHAAATTTSVADLQCNSASVITVTGTTRSTVSSSASCQNRTLTSSAGFSLAASSPAGATVTDSSAMISAGGELYESFVAGTREAAVLLTPNRSLMMSRSITGDENIVDWSMGLVVQPVTNGAAAWLTGTYSFLRSNQETATVDAAHQTNAALSQIFDPVTMRVTFNGN